MENHLVQGQVTNLSHFFVDEFESFLHRRPGFSWVLSDQAWPDHLVDCIVVFQVFQLLYKRQQNLSARCDHT